jgi:RHS repeat-associated protein
MYDNIGSVRGLLDASGTATDWYELDTFGRQVSSSGTTPNPYRYGGAWGYISDPSGLEQLGERFYWPELGRFVSQDPVRDGLNWYAYVDNDPTRRTDPTGLSACEAKCMAKLVAQSMACGAAYQAEMFLCARAMDWCELRLGIGNPICKSTAVTCGNAALAQYYQCEAWAIRNYHRCMCKCRNPVCPPAIRRCVHHGCCGAN